MKTLFSRSGLMALVTAVAVVATAAQVRAQTGTCDSNPTGSPTSMQQCINAIQTAGGVVNDIFKDANGTTGPNLPLFGKLYPNWKDSSGNACPESFAGCAGRDTAPYDCPKQYTCDTTPNDFATAAQYVAGLDHLWWHPCRSSTHTLGANGCPVFTCVANGQGGNYLPWEGMVFDLGGPSNRVAIFATNDHGPQPCESIEYTVYLTDNPLSQEIIQKPTTVGADPQKWNRAVLEKIYTDGWYNTRAPDPTGHASCGDTANYAVEQDSFAQVFALPCGITFRYAAIVAGYDGQDFPECGFDSNEAELDAVAGLTEEGTGVCPDKDGDNYVDCNCVEAPKVCDCNDGDPSVHPGAPEACDDADKNCDGVPGSCPAGEFCNASVCVKGCGSGEFSCPSGSSCQSTDQGSLCIPNDCSTGGCPPGSVCDPVSKTCKPACDGVTCPWSQVCQDGKCIDPCQTTQCPSSQDCVAGKCVPPCSCFSGDVGCTTSGWVCDRGHSDQCVPQACLNKTCAAGEHCNDQGTCVGLCDGVTCPPGQTCIEAKGGCVSLCDGVSCPSGQSCDPKTGKCTGDPCANVFCQPGEVCVAGNCVTSDGGTAPDGGNGVDGGAGGPSRGSATSGQTGGCGCRTAPAQGGALAGLLALVGLLGLAVRRRRRASDPER